MSIDSLPTTPDQAREGCAKGGETIECCPTGIMFSLADPRPEQVDIRDIARSLSLINRYNGHSHYGWSVAAHSVVVAEEIARLGRSPAVCLAALLHDAHEAYTGDITKPLKIMLGDAYKSIANPIQGVIHKRFDLTPSADDLSLIKQIDQVTLRAEASILKVSRGKDWNWGGTRLMARLMNEVREMHAAEAEALFLLRAEMLGIEI